MKNNINIPNQPIVNVQNERIEVNTSSDTFRRYIVKKYDGTIYEVNKSTYNKVKNNPFFEVLILNWYIRGTKEFVRSQNRKELERANNRLNGIKRIIVNPLQFYINDTGA